MASSNSNFFSSYNEEDETLFNKPKKILFTGGTIMSIITGMVANAIVKGAAGAAIGSIVTKVGTAALNATGVLTNATRTTKTVVKVGMIVGGAYVGGKTVDRLIDHANANGAVLTGTEAVAIEMYTPQGVLIGTPTHKKRILVDNLGSEEVPD